MEKALELAAVARGRTSPNPMVGAVVVRDGEIVGSGFHRRFGGPHAEVGALAEAGPRAAGATVYVTLEPCCVWGKTPPCTEALIHAGVARVVVAIEDPNPEIAGRGIGQLRGAGIEVALGVGRRNAERLNAAYLKFRRTGLPRVLLKLALSLDGRITGPPGAPRWVTSEASRDRVHRMRAQCDCVMIGIGTLLADDPLLTDRRSPAAERQPARLVLDSDLRTPPGSAIARTAREIRTFIACAEEADRRREEALSGEGAVVWRFTSGEGGLAVADVLGRAAAEGMIDVLCEGGAGVATSLLSAGLVDDIALFYAPRIFGVEGVAAFGMVPGSCYAGEPLLTEVRLTPCGDDWLLEGRVRRSAERDSDQEKSCSPA